MKVTEQKKKEGDDTRKTNQRKLRGGRETADKKSPVRKDKKSCAVK